MLMNLQEIDVQSNATIVIDHCDGSAVDDYKEDKFRR